LDKKAISIGFAGIKPSGWPQLSALFGYNKDNVPIPIGATPPGIGTLSSSSEELYSSSDEPLFAGGGPTITKTFQHYTR